ncbi:MAG: hypothetical protein NVSMB70_00640 [Chamaesiphon sp.]
MFVVERIVLALYTGSLQVPPKDRLASTLWWRLAVCHQTQLTSGKHYDICLFGDSILAQVGNPFGSKSFSFALGGMSTISLIEQLKILREAQVHCYQAIVAIGTNDAWYGISDETFIQMLKKNIEFLRLMGAKKIILLPAFYSTIAASYDPIKASPIERVEQINALMSKLAVTENVIFEELAIQALFKNKELKEALTTDGVHLNTQGLEIYRQALINFINIS